MPWRTFDPAISSPGFGACSNIIQSGGHSAMSPTINDLSDRLYELFLDADRQ